MRTREIRRRTRADPNEPNVSNETTGGDVRSGREAPMFPLDAGRGEQLTRSPFGRGKEPGDHPKEITDATSGLPGEAAPEARPENIIHGAIGFRV